MSTKKSQLEKVGDVQLFNILKLTLKNIGDEGHEHNMESDTFIDSCHKAMNFVGHKIKTPIDENYIYVCIELNSDMDFTSRLPQSKIKRPQASLYSYIVQADETVYRTVNYAHKIVSYSEDIVLETGRLAEEKGDRYYDEGEIVDEDIYDSNVNDVEYIDGSVRKIKS